MDSVSCSLCLQEWAFWTYNALDELYTEVYYLWEERLLKKEWKVRHRSKTLCNAIMNTAAKYVVTCWAVERSECLDAAAFNTLLLDITMDMDYRVCPGGGFIDTFTTILKWARDLVKKNYGCKPVHMDLIGIVPGYPFLRVQ